MLSEMGFEPVSPLWGEFTAEGQCDAIKIYQLLGDTTAVHFSAGNVIHTWGIRLNLKRGRPM